MSTAYPYGKAHQRLRATLIAALPAPCARCGETIPAGINPRLVQLDHVDVPVRGGGQAGQGALSHRRCNLADGARVTNARARLRRSEAQEISAGGAGFPLGDRRQAALVSHALGPRRPHRRGSGRIGPDRPASPEIRALPAESEAAVLGDPWVKALGPMPDDERLPRIMSGRHPRAVGSYVDAWSDYCRTRLGWAPYWWQALCAARILEHDADGELVWINVLVSTTRQVGKSALLRSLAMFRVDSPALFGETPNVFIASTTMRLASEVMRPAALWADGQPGWRAYRGAQNPHIEAPSGGRWLVGAVDASHSFTVGMPITDEAWGIEAETVADHMEPTMLAAVRPQFLVTSTAHPEATTYVPDLRAQAMSELVDPDHTLIVEWSVDRAFDDVLDEGLWRVASPRWTAQRERLLRAKVASGKVSPVSFRAQYLNQWPDRADVVARAHLADAALYARAQGVGATGRGEPVVVALEDVAGGEQGAVAVAEVRDEHVHLSGEVFPTRRQAWDYVDALSASLVDGDVRVLIGASLVSDPRAETLTVPVELRGARETKTGIGLYRSFLRDGVVVHDVECPGLTSQMLAALITSSASTGARFDDAERHDLATAAVWAVQEAATAFGMVGVRQ
jgi:hypothetical protein